MNRSEFTKSIALLTASVGKSMPDEMVAAWYLLMQDLTAEQLERGIVETLRTHQFAGFPPVGTVRKNAGSVCGAIAVSDRVTVAWAAIKAAVATHGAYATVEFDDPLVTAAIRMLGGWVKICDTEAGDKFDVWLKKEFERTYSALWAAGVSAELTEPLAGMCDQTNSATGHVNRQAVHRVEVGLPAPPKNLVKAPTTRRIEHSDVAADLANTFQGTD